VIFRKLSTITTQIKRKEGASMYKEKSGVEVIVIGKRLIVYDDKANEVGQCKLNNYKWEVKKA